MNFTEKQIIKVLLEGGNIAHDGISGIRLRDKKFNPIRRVTHRRFSLLKDLMKKDKRGLWVISPKNILKLRGNSWAKKQYKLIRNTQEK